MDEIEKGLRALGIVPGDTVFVQSDLMRIGLAKSKKGKVRLAVSPEALHAALTGIIGKEGTIVVPAFSLSWSDGGDFDPDNDPVQTGAFSEYVRKLPGARRTRHPLLSFAAIGADAEEICAHGESAFGEGSVFPALQELNAKFLLVGVGVCCFKDHVEAMLNVPYRYSKTFDGHTIESGRRVATRCRHFVRYRHGGKDTVMKIFWDGLTEAERADLSRVRFGATHACALEIGYLGSLLERILKDDPYRFVIDLPCSRDVLDFLARCRQFRSGDGWQLNAEFTQGEGSERVKWSVVETASGKLLGKITCGDLDTPGASVCINAAERVAQNASLIVRERTVLRFLGVLGLTDAATMASVTSAGDHPK